MRAIKINGTKVKIWARSLDIYGWEQVMNMSKLPFLSEQGISLMPDAHAGTGVPIGTVLPCIKAVIPTAVGNDAGCGMRAMKTNICVEEISQDRVWYASHENQYLCRRDLSGYLEEGDHEGDQKEDHDW